MSDFLSRIFDPSGYPPRWTCGEWSPIEGWLHIISDGSIALAYFLIPLTLVYVLISKGIKVLPELKQTIILFSLFIFFCGFTHMMDATMFYHPIYRFLGLCKFATAIVSWITLIHLGKNIRTFLLLKPNDEYQKMFEQAEMERERFEGAFMSAGVGMGLVAPDGRWLKVNPALCEMMQYNEEEMLSMTFMDHTHPDDIAPDLELFNPTVEGERETYQMRKRYIRKDGSVFPLRLTVSAVRDETGRFIHSVSQVEDITLLEAEEERAALAELTLKTAKIGTWRMDKNHPEQRLIWDEGLKDIFETDVYDYGDFSDMVDPEYVDMVNERVNNCIENGVPYEADFYINTAKGNRKFIAARGMMLGESFTGIAIDFTDKQETVEDLERSNDELAKFAYITSHDLKTPLRGIVSLSGWINSWLEKRGNLDDEMQEYVDLLQSRVRRMEALIDGILEYSRVGRMDTEKEWVPFKEKFEHTVADLSEVYPDVEFVCEGEMPTLYVNRTRMRQVITNLMDNACKHGRVPDRDVVIKFSYEELPHHHKFIVSDNGKGIDPKYHEKIFQIFQTLQSKDKVESTGIGLTLVKKIAESYDGGAGVESELGEGSHFWFTLSKRETNEVVENPSN